MFFQHILKPQQLTEVIKNVEECLFVISAQLSNRSYDVAVYKYNEEYFVLDDSRIFDQIRGIGDEAQGDEEQVLPYIETALEENLYFMVKEDYVCLDLMILSKMKHVGLVDVKYYEFIDM